MGEAKRRRIAGINRSDLSKVASTGEITNDWKLSDDLVLQEVHRSLDRHGVDFSKPGFHDSDAFLLAEKSDSTFIDNVARLVEARTYLTEELQIAADKVKIATEAVYAAVQADGRHGLCVTASGVLSRMLDELGVWNYCAKTTLTVSFPASVSRSPRYFYAIDKGAFTAPHAIVVAPPYGIIDITAKHQAYDVQGMSEALPSIVMSSTFAPYAWTIEDIVAPEIFELRRLQHLEFEAYLRTRKPQVMKIMNALQSRQVSFSNGAVLSYVIVGTGGFSERLEDLGEAANINGRRPIDIFIEDVLPWVKANK